jgi:Zn-dependent peptidase ImmA (M78 family)/transcriptional regulator with XRE-family HTH domain
VTDENSDTSGVPDTGAVRDVLARIDPRSLGQRLQEARKARGRTQQEVADYLGAARTTVVAIEKGERAIRPTELVRLAVYYGRTLGEFLREGQPVDAFAVQLRASLAPGPDSATEQQLAECTLDFQLLSEDYLELERLTGSSMPRRYPPPYPITGPDPESAGEDVAVSERNRLGLGDGPLLNLRELLENDVGLRVFVMDLAPKVSAMFAYTEQVGGCIAVNRKHPADRRRMSVAHEYGHFLSKRYAPEVAFLGRVRRRPDLERFADAFARAFLLPATGLQRRFHELQRNRDGGLPTPADLCTLAHFYFVSVEGLAVRLEELRLLPVGTWDRLKQAGFKVREAQALLGLPARPEDEPLLPVRYRYLAIEAYQRADLSEGQFARYLRADRVEARRMAAGLVSRPDVDDEGAVSALPLDLSGALV